MNVADLLPRPILRQGFLRSRSVHVADCSGCYVLATFDGVIIYIGLSVNIRRRLLEHLDTPAKVGLTHDGRAVWIYWLPTPNTNKVERSWLNMHQLAEGRLPILNTLYSPTHT